MGTTVSASRPRRARAFAPGHVTGIFLPETSARDPRARGSRGAGLVLSLGVTAAVTWTPTARRTVRVAADVPNPLPISEEVARRLYGGSRGSLSVRLRHDLPIGQGFGTSAAGALATGLAVAQVLDLPRSRAIEVAHLAELFGGGGLGGVAAILGGGLEVRERPGIPPFGSVRHRPLSGTVLLGVVGRPIPSPKQLKDAGLADRARRAARGFVPGRSPAGAASFGSQSERFTDRLDLASPRLRTVLQALRREGLHAAQAMFGESFFALVPRSGVPEGVWTGLARARVPAVEVALGRQGARRLRFADPTPRAPRPPPFLLRATAVPQGFRRGGPLARLP